MRSWLMWGHEDGNTNAELLHNSRNLRRASDFPESANVMSQGDFITLDGFFLWEHTPNVSPPTIFEAPVWFQLFYQMVDISEQSLPSELAWRVFRNLPLPELQDI